MDVLFFCSDGENSLPPPMREAHQNKRSGRAPANRLRRFVGCRQRVEPRCPLHSITGHPVWMSCFLVQTERTRYLHPCAKRIKIRGPAGLLRIASGDSWDAGSESSLVARSKYNRTSDSDVLLFCSDGDMARPETHWASGLFQSADQLSSFRWKFPSTWTPSWTTRNAWGSMAWTAWRSSSISYLDRQTNSTWTGWPV